jgi:HlyD family secretion protein
MMEHNSTPSRRKVRRIWLSVLLLVLTAYLVLTVIQPRVSNPSQPAGGASAPSETTAQAQEPTPQEQVSPVTETATNDATPTPSARQVQIIPAKRDTLSATRVTAVRIEPAQQSSVAAGTSGRVEAVLKQKDERVTAGEVVVRLDTQRLRLEAQDAQLAYERASVELQTAQQANREDQGQASDRLVAAEAALRPLEQKVTEARELYQAGSIARSELESLEADYAQAQSDYNQARNDVARSGRADTEALEVLRLQMEQAQTQLELTQDAIADSNIRAPFEGEITDMLVSVGEFLSDGSPAFELASTTEQVARFNVPPEIAARLQSEGLVYVSFSGLDYAAAVTTVGSVDVETQLVEVTAKLYDSETRLQNGVVTQFPYSYEVATGILLPSAAVQREGTTLYTFVVENNRTVRRLVTSLGEVSNQIVVAGLEEGENVVYPVPEGLRDGMTVEVVSAQ